MPGFRQDPIASANEFAERISPVVVLDLDVDARGRIRQRTREFVQLRARARSNANDEIAITPRVDDCGSARKFESHASARPPRESRVFRGVACDRQCVKGGERSRRYA